MVESIKKVKASKPSDYPKLLESVLSKVVVFYINENFGVVVYEGSSGLKIGDVVDGDSMERFGEFAGDITLKNV